MKRATLVLALAAAMIAPPAALAQYVPRPPQVYNSWTFHNTRQALTNRAIGRRVLEQSLQRRPPATPRLPSAPAPTAGSLTFRPVGPPIVPAEFAARAARDPAGRAQMKQMFDEALVEYEKALKAKGLPLYDVARAASFAIASSYIAVNGNREMTEAQLEGLRGQVRQALSGHREFQAMSDRDRQELYETYAIIGMFLPAMADIAKESGNKALETQVRAAAREQLEGMFGVPAGRLYASAEGIRVR